MRRPLHHIDTCGHCHGEGGTSECDYDGEDPQTVRVDCPTCTNSGLVASCDFCDCIMPAPTAELAGYICATCLVAQELAS